LAAFLVAAAAGFLGCEDDGPPLPGSLAWAVCAGGPNFDHGFAVAARPDGSAAVTGCFESISRFGPGEPNETVFASNGGQDVFVARLGPDGRLAWAKRAGGARKDNGRGVAALPDGSTVIAGFFEGVATFGRGEANETVLTCASEQDIFVARYGPDGSLAWARRAGGADASAGQGVAALPDGSALVTGCFKGVATFGPGEAGETVLEAACLEVGGEAGMGDIFLARYGPDGSLAWAKRAGGTDWDEGHGVAVLADGSALVTGCFGGAATFGAGEPRETSLTSAGGSDIFIARFSPDGRLAWARRAGGADDDDGIAAAALGGNSVAVVGYFGGVATFGPGGPDETRLASAGAHDIFVARYGPDGALAWARRAGGASLDWGYGIAAFQDGSVAVTGFFAGSAAFGPGEPDETVLTASGPDARCNDAFVARYGSDGALAWARRAGGVEADQGRAVAVLADGSVVVTGDFRGAATFGPEEPDETILTSTEGSDVFVARFRP